MNTKVCWSLPALFLAAVVVIPWSAGAEGKSLIPSTSPAAGPCDLGIVFNTSDILFGLENYQGGIGAAIGWGNLQLRGLVGLAVNGSSQAFGINAGVTVLYLLLPGPISPYLGVYAGGGYSTLANVSSVMSASLGAVAGVELFLFDFLSIFAEYALAADFSNTTDLQTSQSTFDYLINTRMGNNTKLGVIIYFMRSRTKDKEH